MHGHLRDAINARADIRLGPRDTPRETIRWPAPTFVPRRRISCLQALKRQRLDDLDELRMLAPPLPA